MQRGGDADRDGDGDGMKGWGEWDADEMGLGRAR